MESTSTRAGERGTLHCGHGREDMQSVITGHEWFNARREALHDVSGAALPAVAVHLRAAPTYLSLAATPQLCHSCAQRGPTAP